MADLPNWLRDAVQRTSEQPPGKKFEVKNLFKGVEWDKLTSGEKRQLGILYSTEYKEGRIPSIRRITNNKQHHNMYEKF